MSEPLDSCVEPARGPVLESSTERDAQRETKEVAMATARVGKVAPVSAVAATGGCAS